MLQGVASLVIIWDAEDMSMSGVNVGIYVEKGVDQAAIVIGKNQALFGFGLTHVVKLP